MINKVRYGSNHISLLCDSTLSNVLFKIFILIYFIVTEKKNIILEEKRMVKTKIFMCEISNITLIYWKLGSLKFSTIFDLNIDYSHWISGSQVAQLLELHSCCFAGIIISTEWLPFSTQPCTQGLLGFRFTILHSPGHISILSPITLLANSRPLSEWRIYERLK